MEIPNGELFEGQFSIKHFINTFGTSGDLFGGLFLIFTLGIHRRNLCMNFSQSKDCYVFKNVSHQTVYAFSSNLQH